MCEDPIINIIINLNNSQNLMSMIEITDFVNFFFSFFNK